MVCFLRGSIWRLENICVNQLGQKLVHNESLPKLITPKNISPKIYRIFNFLFLRIGIGWIFWYFLKKHFWWFVGRYTSYLYSKLQPIWSTLISQPQNYPGPLENIHPISRYCPYHTLMELVYTTVSSQAPTTSHAKEIGIHTILLIGNKKRPMSIWRIKKFGQIGDTNPSQYGEFFCESSQCGK